MPADRQILIIDETIREGMQYMGVMLSLEQRRRILDFQQALGVDICQAGYPPAHESEKQIVASLVRHAGKHRYHTRIAAMGRLKRSDAAILMQTGILDFHFHIHLEDRLSRQELKTEIDSINDTARSIKRQCPGAVISVAMLDIGRCESLFLETCARHLDNGPVDILSLPDTSGMMAPNQMFEKISGVSSTLARTDISIHCHNDLGMANANGVMGILAGGRVLEATALGIGERNGLSDLYTTALQLRKQGYRMNLKTDDFDCFTAYYKYVDAIVCEQTGHHLLTLNTPAFGDAVKTHVAGTHSCATYGLQKEEKIHLNSLCGKHLVKKFIAMHDIECPEQLLGRLTLEIKNKSFENNCSLSPTQVRELIAALQQNPAI